jgi:TRAP-type C4-dicarboxylate transport system permease small subunit
VINPGAENIRGYYAMKTLTTVSRILTSNLRAAAGILMLVILALIFAEVISRYIFEEGHDFVPELSAWIMVWMAYLMIGINIKFRRDIMVDILPTRLPERYRTPLFICFDIVSLIFAILLVWAGIQYCEIVAHIGVKSTTSLAIHMWIVRLCVPIGSIFLAIFSIDRLITDIDSLKKSTVGKE